MSFFNRSLAVFFATALSLSLVGCNTMSGIGQDISAGGGALTKSADQTKGDMDDDSSSNSASNTTES
jgi:entericidin B